MTLDTGPAAFALRSYVAAMLAYWVALKIGLPRPFWAVTTVYLVSQPLAAAVLSKAAYRLGGTVLGAAAAVVLVPNFVNEPAVLSFAMAAWLGLCMFVSVHDRTPRAYTFLLAGYTASIIGFPSVNFPAGIFGTAVVRVQEIVVGILAATVLHGFVFPTTLAQQLSSRLQQIRTSTKTWTVQALAGERSDAFRRERQRLIVDINDLGQLGHHLPFDMALVIPPRRAIRALQHQLSLMVAVTRAVEDRLDALRGLPQGVPMGMAQTIQRVRDWLGRDDDLLFGRQADDLIVMVRKHEPDVAQPWTWREMLLQNVTGRLIDLICAHRDTFYLVNVIEGKPPGDRAGVEEMLRNAGPRSAHTDTGLAARAALGAAATVLLACCFWITTEWPDGAVGALIAGVTCALFGSLDNPAPAARKFLAGSILGCCLATFYGFVVLPRVTDFVVLAAVLAPSLILLGSALARPRTALFALGTLIGLLNTVGLNASYDGDFMSFINSAIAQNVGTAFAIFALSVFRTLGSDEGIRRLRRAGFRDVIRRIEGEYPDVATWTSRMLDRVGMLVTRTMMQSTQQGGDAVQALQDLRIGVAAGDLRSLAMLATERQQASIDDVLRSVTSFYRERIRDVRVSPSPRLLAEVDSLAHEFHADPDEVRRRTAAGLVMSLRCNLFPSATLVGLSW
ncbi:FUSC family protein [Paraburkholderia sp. BL25I1N1]|uniref:FUSC family protein n=1 Tax=Paraburkholderia sp. BL25I1N1 TaxID=1938804 RepID=UPI000D056918|nr:FUSC family protein [Paraburkholderia sp. BL25I1N1]PRY05989.1 putative membrane protein YccC [Paraburkholderia sp. BL25I1N1]